MPTDAWLVEAANLAVDESPLTGESVPVQKSTGPLEGEATIADMGNMVHMGTAVVNGHGIAVVTATGMQTQIGKITAQVQQAKPPPTPLQQNVASLGRYIGILVLGIIVFLIVAGLAKGYGFLDIFTLGVAAAVSAIPEGLPVMVTVVLALGMRRMAKRNAIIRKLPAVETMGAVTVICSDKTGTLTKSEMTVRQIYVDERLIEVSGAGYHPQGEFLTRSRTSLTARTTKRARWLCEREHTAWRSGTTVMSMNIATIRIAAIILLHPALDENCRPMQGERI